MSRACAIEGVEKLRLEDVTSPRRSSCGALSEPISTRPGPFASPQEPKSDRDNLPSPIPDQPVILKHSVLRYIYQETMPVSCPVSGAHMRHGADQNDDEACALRFSTLSIRAFDGNT